jgi:phosphoglycolate phosphatase
MPKKHKTKLVLFDLDGTLIDTAPDFLSSLNKVLIDNGEDVITEEELRFHISEGTSKMIKTFFKIEEDDVNFEKYKNQFLSEYKSNLTKKSKLFDGIKSLIQYLESNSIMYGVVTNKYFEYAKPIIESFPELSNVKIIICPDHVSISKPDPEGILQACNKLNVTPDDTIYLGDHLNDLMAGEAAGTKVIGCLYGYSLDQNIINSKGYNCVKNVSEITSHLD